MSQLFPCYTSCYFTKINYPEMDVMINKTAVGSVTFGC